MKKLIIVESPAKSKTISSYIGNGAIVLSSKGHIRDLSTTGPGGLGIDVAHHFEPTYKVIPGKEKIVESLIKYAEGKEVLIATDPDREGEAIGWHLAQVLNLDLTKKNRVIFREITKNTILEALNHPRTIDQDLVNSQEARRMLDRIIGFKLSSLLNKKIRSKSAGRVQSVALKLIVDLEKEIIAFIPETYYEIKAKFAHFEADYIVGKTRLNKEKADQIVLESNAPFKVVKVEEKESKRMAKPPFITSTLQQDAINYLNFSSTKVMSVAQKLYEGVEIKGELTGLITYMRTDSTRLSSEFVAQAKTYIKDQFGPEYYGSYKTGTKETAQDAHEAIRPTNLKYHPDSIETYLTKEEFKLYKRIYERTLASLMAPAVFDKTKVVLDTNKHLYQLEGSVLKFDGHLKVYQESKNKDVMIPKFKLDEQFDAIKVESIEKVTTPKARYSEATLIKEMESLGIGRPSTYTQTISTLKARSYIIYEQKRLKPTEQGMLTSEQLDLFFNKIINTAYTSKMEEELDLVSEGKASGVQLVKTFYETFIPMIEHADIHMEKIGPKPTDEVCPLCGRPLVVRTSNYGPFIACSGFPKCKYIKREQ